MRARGVAVLARLGVQTLFIEPGSPWENGYIESFNGKLRDELLNGEVFSSVPEAKVLTDAWRRHYNPADLTAHWDIGHPHRWSLNRNSQPHPGCGYICGGRSHPDK
jgi:hypothetical protein